MVQFLNKLKYSIKTNIKKINVSELYKIGLYEIIILFIILFFTYTMPMTMYKFTSSFFGKLVSLVAIISATYYNIAYGVVLAGLFIGISEIGYLEGFAEAEGFSKKPDIPSAKEAFIKEHCANNKKTKFDLDTINTDYPSLVFTHGVCDPCDPTCRYNISHKEESLYDFDQKIKPKDSTYVDKLVPVDKLAPVDPPKTIENFESNIINSVKEKYNTTKRKARMLKDGFTGSIVDNAKHYARKYNL